MSYQIFIYLQYGEDEKCFENWKMLSIFNLFLKFAEGWSLIIPSELIENEDAQEIKPIYLPFVS